MVSWESKLAPISLPISQIYLPTGSDSTRENNMSSSPNSEDHRIRSKGVPVSIKRFMLALSGGVVDAA